MKTDPTDILKEAILLEKRGHAFYKTVAGQTKNDAVRQFFEFIADEEQKHVEYLSDQFGMYQAKNKFVPVDTANTEPGDLSALILSDHMREKISAAGFEAAAISAAMLMEQRAIKLYSERSEKSSDAEEKALYDWLAQWERTHLKYLAEIDRALKESVWYNNQFWPF